MLGSVLASARFSQKTFSETKMSLVQVHAYAVCDDPDYFYNYTQELIDGLNAGVDTRDIVKIINVSYFSLIPFASNF